MYVHLHQIANSTNLKYSKKFSFKNHTKCKPSPNLNCWIVIEWGFHGNFVIRLHGGHKKLNYFSIKHDLVKAHVICHLVELFCDNNNVILEFADVHGMLR